MSALNTFKRIINNKNLINANFKYCLVDENKIPFKLNGENAKPNQIEDFVSLEKLIDFKDFEKYAGLGISIQGSNICAIDVDKCFSIPFNLDSADERALDIIDRFMNFAYIEFSFSGKGLRVFFKNKLISNYCNNFYIKNKNYNIEFYQPNQSYRYVTITGFYIVNNSVSEYDRESGEVISKFLNDYMKRTAREKKSINAVENDSRSLNDIMKKVRTKLLINYVFQEKWFSKAPGSNSNESEIDFYLLGYLYENITQDKEKLRLVFESSPYFKSKDNKHLRKWMNDNYRYYNYVYERLR